MADPEGYGKTALEAASLREVTSAVSSFLEADPPLPAIVSALADVADDAPDQPLAPEAGIPAAPRDGVTDGSYSRREVPGVGSGDLAPLAVSGASSPRRDEKKATTVPAAPSEVPTFQGMAVHEDPNGDLYVIQGSRRTFLRDPRSPRAGLGMKDVRVEAGRIVPAGDDSGLEIPAAGSVNSGLLPDSGGLVIRDYQLYRGEDPVLVDGHAVGLGVRGLYITIEHGPTAGMYWLRAGSSKYLNMDQVCWQAGHGGGGMQGRLVERGTNTPVEQGERTTLPSAAALAASQPAARAVFDADSLPQSGRAGERYVVAHGEQGEENTFIPGDLRVQFYSEEGVLLPRTAPVLQHLGVKIPTPSMKDPGDPINNYTLTANTREEWGQFKLLLEMLPESEVLYLGNAPLPVKMQLCSRPDKCEEYRLAQEEYRLAQKEDGVEIVARHRDKCTGLFGPKRAQFLGEIVHLLICRGSTADQQ
ncbi:hypothetical protein, partial [Streptomyces sp. NPDC055085]